MRSNWSCKPGLAASAALALAFASLAVAASNEPASLVDTKVANYAIPDTDHSSPAFEQFSFSVGRDGNTRIDYGYGVPNKQLVVRQVKSAAGMKGFAVRFPNGHVFDIVPASDTLVVSDRDSDYRKTFTWRYEGPVDGVGTFCTSCVEENEAMGFVRSNFIKTGK